MLAPQTLTEATALAAQRDGLVTKLEARWRWLDANPGHPQFREREDKALIDLATYEAMEDALREAATRLLGGRVA